MDGLRQGPALSGQAGQHRTAAWALAPHAAYRRNSSKREKFEAEIQKLNRRAEEQTCERPGAMRRVTHSRETRALALAVRFSGAEIGAIRVVEDDSADTRFGIHHHALRQLHSDIAGL
jgi:hypothetical protein